MNPPIEFVGAVIAGLTLAAAVMVVTSKIPIHAACFLILTLVGVAAEFAILESHILAIFQVLVYAGAIVVLIAFTLMLMGSKKPIDLEDVPINSWRVIVGGVMSVLMLALLAYALSIERNPFAETQLPRSYGQLPSLGELLLGPYVFAFEVISLVLMVGIVGAVALLKQRPVTEGKEGDR
jgi:NADH-quinone oxidoreductase subunit J